MDKPKNGKTITIKINGKESPFKENKQKNPINKKTKESEKQQQSHLPQQVKLEAAAAKEPIEDDEQFDWILPTAGNIPEEEVQTLPPEKKKNDQSKMSSYKGKGIKIKSFSTKGINVSMVLAVFFAVILGTFFGLLLLKVVPSEKVIGEEAPAPVVENEQPSDTPVAVSGNVELTLPSLSTAVVQEGVYSSQSGAEDIQATLKDKAPSAILSVNGSFAIFVSVADNVADAKTMGSRFNTSGISTFSKEFVIEEKTVKNLQEEEKKLLELSPLLYETLLASVTSASISNSIPASLIKDFEKQTSSLARIDKSKLQNKEIIGIHSQLEAATAQLKIYNKSPEASTLNRIQQHLLSFLAHYQSLK